MTDINYEDVLDLPMEENDSGETTIRGYLVKLLSELWAEQDGFSGKRPFGNSGWDFDLQKALLKGGLISGKLDEYGYIEECDRKEGDRIIAEAILTLR